MYVYFNKQGILTTVIPHGEVVRQGSYLNLYICTDKDFYNKNNNYICNVTLSFPDGTSGTPFVADEVDTLPFEKIDDSEITYDLIPGERYSTWIFRFPPEMSTVDFGKITAHISLEKNTENNENDLKYNGNVEIYVEKTFGYSKKINNLTNDNYENLLLQINKLDAKKLDKIGSENIELKLNNFKEESNENFLSLKSNESEYDSIKNNKYKLIKLIKNDNSESVFHLISHNGTGFYFVNLKSNKTYQLLFYNINQKKWILYNENDLINREDLENIDTAFIKDGAITREKIKNEAINEKKLDPSLLEKIQTPGPKGDPGLPGEKPKITIVDNIWHVDGVSTGVQAKGEKGPQGPAGPEGPQGTGVSIKGTAYKGTANADTDGTLVDKDGNVIKGNEGDSYIVDDDIDALYVYVKEENGQSIWHCVGAIQGPRGYTPEIKENGYWYINEKPTGVKAEGRGIKSIERDVDYNKDNQFKYILTYTDETSFTYYVKNGIDGITPQFKIENKKWQVSYDEGKTWEPLNQVAQGITPRVRINRNEWEVSYDEEKTWEPLNQVARGPQGFTPSFKVEGDILWANTEQAPSIFNQNVGNVKGTGISHISGPDVDGTKRTYTIHLTDRSSYPITVYDGENANDISLDNFNETLREAFNNKYDNIGDIIYTNEKPVPVAIGGIDAGETFEDISIKDLINKLLYPYVAPTLYSNSTNLTADTFKYDTVQEIATVDVKIKKGTNNIQNIKLLFNSEEIGNSSDFTESAGIITCNFSNIGHTFNTNGTLKITIIEEGNKEINITLKSYKFVYPSYVGNSTVELIEELTAEEITSSLNEIVSSNKITSHTYELTNERAVIAYPATYGKIIQIKDNSGFDVTGTFSYKGVTINGVAYHVYANDPSTVESITYKFSYGG